MGRGSNELGRGINNHRILIPELFYLQTAQKRRKSKVGGTDRRTDRPTRGLIGRVARDKKKGEETERERPAREKREKGRNTREETNFGGRGRLEEEKKGREKKERRKITEEAED